ncbi:MAG: hypothetical protein H6793_02710 [Candidatus Nomurabacteria bacterium]|nr:hypothetical protein [Candidatus Saccharibacteria bacterium]USN95222.1 MAG: hypothetical protein H6793_02710 [Candidatus Nomurabacteria bacterium]
MRRKKYLEMVVILVVSLGLSIFLYRSEVSYNSNPCISPSACEETILGTKTEKWLGFPAYYKIHVTFVPNEDTNQGFESLGGDTQYNMILINTLFWAFAIYGSAQIVYFLVKKNKSKK